MKRFSDFFPPPDFLRMPAAGIDVAEDAIRAVQFSKKNGTVNVQHVITKPITVGTIKNGEIVNPEELQRVLREIKTEGKFEFARLSLPEEKAYIFRTAVPLAAHSAIRDSIEFQLEENIPLSPQETTFDYTILTPDRHDSNHLDVAVVAVSRQYVKAYVELIKSSGISPLSFAIAPSALVCALLPHAGYGASMIVHFYEQKTVIIIASQGAVQFASTIGIGGSALTSSIEKHFGIGTEEARKIKRAEVYIKDKGRIELFFSLMNTVSALKDEILRLITYWQTFKGRGDELGDRIQKIILCGEDAALPGLDEYLSIMLNIAVHV